VRLDLFHRLTAPAAFGPSALECFFFLESQGPSAKAKLLHGGGFVMRAALCVCCHHFGGPRSQSDFQIQANHAPPSP
jgi:hypothetical protein